MLTRLATAAACCSLLLMSASGSAESQDRTVDDRTTVVDLRDLPVGPPPTSLYSAGAVIHDGAATIPVDVDVPMRLLGRVVGGYAVETSTPSGFYGKLLIVDPATGDTVRLGRTTDLDRDPRITRGGRDVAYGECCAPPEVTIRSVVTGRVVATRVFPDHAEMVDAAGSRVMVGTPDRGLYWLPFERRLVPFTRRIVSTLAGDAHHRLAYVVVGNPADGCGELVHTGRPDRPLWRRCGLGVVAFSPQAHTVVTTSGSFELRGLSEIEIRRERDGVLLQRYQGVESNPVHYDGERHVVFVAHADGYTAAVRCDFAGSCQRVSDLVRESRFELYALGWTFPTDREGFARFESSFYETER